MAHEPVTAGEQIVVAGYAFRPESFDFDVALTRYDRDGNLDTSFGSGGRVITDLGAAEFAAAVAVTPDGHIVVGGAISRMGASDFLLFRYDFTGRLDPSFGVDGVVVADLFGPDEAMLDMALTPKGDIVVAGTVNDSVVGSESDFGIARFTSDGSLDTSFGLVGRTRVDLGGADRAVALAVEPNGEAVIAGNTLSPSGGADIALARFTRDGRCRLLLGTLQSSSCCLVRRTPLPGIERHEELLGLKDVHLCSTTSGDHIDCNIDPFRTR